MSAHTCREQIDVFRFGVMVVRCGVGEWSGGGGCSVRIPHCVFVPYGVWEYLAEQL